MTGRGWSYAGVAVGGAISVYANIAEKFVDNPHPALDGVVLAAAAPVVLFLMSEIFIAVKGGDLAARAVRVATAIVALVAFVTSFQHLHGLLLARGESPLTAWTYPIGIDGLLVGATAVLWQIRTAARLPEPVTDEATEPAEEPVTAPVDVETPEPVEALTPAPAVRPVRVAAARSSRPQISEPTEQRSDDELRAAAEAAIRDGRLPANPTGNALRTVLGVGAVRARRLADALAG